MSLLWAASLCEILFINNMDQCRYEESQLFSINEFPVTNQMINVRSNL